MDQARSDALFRALPDREARSQLVEMYLPLARRVASRFRRRGQDVDDLFQVASLGLIKAIDRFDPDRGVKFASYAAPTMVGEVKRHFRDKGWSMAVPRPLKDLSVGIRQATETLRQTLGRSPSPQELAEHLGCEEEDVLEVAALGNAYQPSSIDVGFDDDTETTISDRLGKLDPRLALFENLHALQPALADLPQRQQRILSLRFVDDMTQREIADEVGLSQMHVSRLLRRSFETLRGALVP